MNNFDKIVVAPCLTGLNAGSCPVEDDDDDTGIIQPGSCSDPVYAAAHPDECGDNDVTPRLVLKPAAVVTCTGKSVQFATSLIQGETEVDLTTGLLYTVSDTSLAVIGALSGNMTAVAAGIVTVSVTWQTYTAFAQVQIGVGDTCCDNVTASLVLALDNSESMSQPFAGAYPTKLSYAKMLARELFDSMNLTKDFASLFSFNTGITSLLEGSQDVDALNAAVTAIPSSVATTDIHASLSEAIDFANTQSGIKVVVLLSDGVDHGADDPVPIANAFKDAGGFIIVVGIRAKGDGYKLLNKIASGGFFLNAYAATQDATIEYLIGLKSYFCSGNCEPEGDASASRAALNFTGFTKWDVIANEVDLIGAGSDGVAAYDFLPGHGLYVDMAGSGPGFFGSIRTKNAIQFTAFRDYQFSIKVAGNQRSSYDCGIRVQIGTLFDEIITPTSWTEDFIQYDYTTDERFEFYCGADELAKIVISYYEVDAPTGEDEQFGCLIDDVQVTEMIETTLFEDDFDDENMTYINPRCGVGQTYVDFGYAYGYNCYGSGCLEVPPVAQSPDPDALPDVES